MNPETNKTCKNCRWFKQVQGDFLLEVTRTRRTYVHDPVICTARPPRAGRDFPLSFPETDAAFCCSAWAAMPEAKPDGVEG